MFRQNWINERNAILSTLKTTRSNQSWKEVYSISGVSLKLSCYLYRHQGASVAKSQGQILPQIYLPAPALKTEPTARLRKHNLKGVVVSSGLLWAEPQLLHDVGSHARLNKECIYSLINSSFGDLLLGSVVRTDINHARSAEIIHSAQMFLWLYKCKKACEDLSVSCTYAQSRYSARTWYGFTSQPCEPSFTPAF